MIETLPAGTVLRGRYRIERVLGSGGFGHVYLAIDRQTNQQYAVKEYLVTGASGKAQLEHEARVLSQLHHPSLPAFQDAFDERGRYYIVLGYIEGSDLTDCLRIVRQRGEVVSLQRILSWLLSICNAVTFLHNQQPPVIHRDIKPDNIRITPGGTAILVDLGNAKAAADGARTLFFIRHQGTPGYAPLEQYPGGSGTDARSDVYALGGTLYFALTGHEPPSVSARNTSISQGSPDLPTLQEVLAQNPPETEGDPAAGRQFRLGITKPSKPAPRHSRHIAQLATLPPESLDRLNYIIHRAMAMKPRDRYSSVAEMSSDLRAVLASLPSGTTPPAAQDRPFDPHSTQPDLPFIYETWQNMNQGSSTQAPGQSSPSSSSTSSPAPDMMQRCPRCQAELPKTATFCPRCGSPLSGQPPRTSQDRGDAPARSSSGGNDRTPQNTAAKDVAAEPTMIYNPIQSPTLRRKTTTGTTGSPRPVTQPQASAGTSSSAQFAPRPSQAQSTGPRPFIQTVAPASWPDGETKTAQPPQSAPASIAYNNDLVPSSGSAARNSAQKVLLYAIAAFVIVLLIIVLLLLTHQGHAAMTPLRSGQNYSV